MADEQFAEGSFCWTELMTRDAARAKRFYGALIGWQMRDDHSLAPGRPYTLFTPPNQEQAAAGMMMMDGPEFEGVPPHWLTYIAVKDIEAKARLCTELGGKVEKPPTDIPNVGRFCVIRDPGGALLALLEG
jgi:predicted enzyme related to lactoylglutathione lyase